ncbi:uncharacterized protein LOC135385589 [Ornithodoros turicata]|uniref:uncharacterized protein LOC135385589 n=1 Tax=Ornithodoros turicata TaxID=34597 RepID=UPI003138AC56
MAVLSRCCVVWNVRDGTLYIGIICIISRVLAAIACVAVIASYYKEPSRHVERVDKLTFIKLLLPDNVFVVIFSALLVIGLLKNRRYYLIPWIIWMSASCIILIILWIIRSIIAIKDKETEDLTFLLAAVVIFGLQAYFILCVVSHYQNMKLSNRRRSVVM